MLHKDLEVALNKQVNLELWSGYLYLAMSYNMTYKGFTGIARWFDKQAKEEYQHAQRIINHIVAMNGQVELLPIAEVRKEWNSPKDVFEDTLMHEKQVTVHIHKIYEQVLSMKHYASRQLLEWLVNEQIEEEETPRAILEAINKIGNDTAAMYMLDHELGKRAE